MHPHPHTVFVNRPPRRRSRMPQLLGSATLAAALLAALVLIGEWQAGPSHAAAPAPSLPSAAGSEDPSVPAASDVLRNAVPVPDDAIATF